MGELEDLKQKVEQLNQQLSGLAGERSAYRQKADSYEKLIQQLDPSSIRYDANGMPIGFNAPETTPSKAVNTGGHPFAGLVDDVSAVDSWAQQTINQLTAKQGYVTQPQLNQIARQMYEAARNDALLWRNYDQLTAKEIEAGGKKDYPYRPLTDYSSDFSKSVARTLQDKGWGAPMSDNAKSFATDWRYANEKALEWAADLVRLDQANQAQQARTAQQTGAAAQAGTGLSVQSQGGAAGGSSRVDELIQQGASVEDVEAAMEQETSGK